jgi:hypothetical protein
MALLSYHFRQGILKMQAQLILGSLILGDLLGGGAFGPAVPWQDDSLASLAQTINDILIQLALFGVPVLLAAGFVMILFSGINPQWKQRGIETIKWTIIGAIGLGIGVGVIQGFIIASGGLSAEGTTPQ